MWSRKQKAPMLFSSCLLLGFAAIQPPPPGERPADLLALQELQSAFHGSGTYGDAEWMASIWTEDAVFRGGGQTIVGREQIVAFFENSPGWGSTVNLAPTYKTRYEFHGNEATMRFECIIVEVTGSAPETTPLSSLPPGSQNTNVEIVQHSNATIHAVKEKGKWLIDRFDGAGGPILP